MELHYKAIISDHDGTLVGADLNVSDRLRWAVKHYESLGGCFSVATGRPFAGVLERTAKKLGLTVPLIVDGGAEIIDPVQGKVLHGEYLEEQTARQVLAELEKRGLCSMIYRDGYLYISDMEEARSTRYSYLPMNELGSGPVSKVRYIFDSLDEGVAKQAAEDIAALFPDLHIVRSDTPTATGYDVTSARATKYTAALRLSEMLGVSPKHIIGIGDGHNDYPLLSACGYKVAMGNAPTVLKELADRVTASQQGEGVAQVVEDACRGIIPPSL